MPDLHFLLGCLVHPSDGSLRKCRYTYRDGELSVAAQAHTVHSLPAKDRGRDKKEGGRERHECQILPKLVIHLPTVRVTS